MKLKVFRMSEKEEKMLQKIQAKGGYISIAETLRALIREKAKVVA